MNRIVDVLDFLWGIPLTTFVILAGLYFSKCINFIQIKNIKLIYNNTINRIKENNSFKTITSVLGGTVGSGNIVGIAAAISIGGPGAIFWMWIVALLSMATKMVEVTMAVYYQKKDKNGNAYGGAMYYIKSINGSKGKILAFIYSLALLTYVLCDSGFVQINTVATSIMYTFNVDKMLVGIFILFVSIFIVKGGLKRISDILKKVVPFMCILYILLSLIIIIVNYNNIGISLINIFKYAFKPTPIIGGFVGSTILQTISKGASRGIFANEAGTGTSTTVHATSNNKPLVQGLWGIVEVYVVSFIICTITALLVLTTNTWTSNLDGSLIILEAFKNGYGLFGKYLVCVMLCLFAYTTYIGFYYEYTTCIKYIFKEKFFDILKWFYIFPIILAVYLPINTIWTLADMSVGFIIIPNIISLLLLSSKFNKIFKSEKKYLVGKI